VDILHFGTKIEIRVAAVLQAAVQVKNIIETVLQVKFVVAVAGAKASIVKT
jgi:hypothetical protein